MLEVRAWMFSLMQSPWWKGWIGWLLSIIDLHYSCHISLFFMCFMYLFQPLLPDPHSNMNMTYDHCRLLREKHNDKVSVLNWNKFVPILADCVCARSYSVYYKYWQHQRQYKGQFGLSTLRHVFIRISGLLDQQFTLYF